MYTDYESMNSELSSLIQGVSHSVANLANASALLYSRMEGLNWAGFYLLDGDRLVLGPFQGKTACIYIPMGKGVCGTAARDMTTVLVPDVHNFPGHIACDSASNSEIVIPIIVHDRLMGVLDIDSPLLGRFDGADKVGLEAFVKILEQHSEMWQSR